FQAEDGIRDFHVTGVQTCALPICDCYGTAGDLNVSEVADVIPSCRRLGLEHPQEGIVRGHFAPEPDALRATVRNLRSGVEAPVPDAFGVPGTSLTVSAMVAGLGGARAVREGSATGGASGGGSRAPAGARLAGIADERPARATPEGRGAYEIAGLFLRRMGRLLPAVDHRLLPAADRDRLLDLPADVYVCAAVSGSLTMERLARLAAAGVTVIACGANHPFHERRLGSTCVARQADRHFSVLADFLANCGLARAYSYLMENGARPDADRIFKAVERTIQDTIDEVLARNGGRPRGLLAATVGLGLDRIGAP